VKQELKLGHLKRTNSTKKGHPDIHEYQDGPGLVGNAYCYKFTFTTGEKIMSSMPAIFNPMRAKT